MRRINKNAEPKEWLAHRMTPGADYQAMPELRQSLIQEQGYICAYCMRRIHIADKDSVEKTRIEHLLSREKHPDKRMDYSNMVLCCNGEMDSNHHCDRFKGSNDLTFDLFSDSFFTTLSYKSKSGEICCSSTIHSHEINQILNLNHKLLKANRHGALNGVIRYLNSTGWKTANINNQLSIWDNKDSRGHYKEYCGIIVWFLKKKLSQTKP